jgi:GH25 family lysozyme M1 (1,4-beta-N-acetylmuramidase)
MEFVPVIDVSHHQNTIDFGVMRSRGVEGVIIRASRSGGPDKRVGVHAKGARAGGFPDERIGFYTFCNPSAAKPRDAAKRFVDAVHTAFGRTDTLLMLDVEEYEPDGIGALGAISGPAFAGWIREHVDVVTELAPGAKVILYTTAQYWDSHVGDPGFGHHDVILARYPFTTKPQPPTTPADWGTWIHGATKRRPAVPKGWTDWAGWQFSAGGNGQAAFYGCSGEHLDLNIIRQEAWSRWTGGGIDLAAIDRALRAVPFPGDLVAPATGDAAVAVVWCLTAAGFGPDGEAEHTFGEPSAAACRRFQAAKGLPETGVVDAATWQALVAPPTPAAPAPVTPPAPARTVVVQPGDGWIRIAKRAMGSDARWRELAALNGGEDRVLHPGDVLTLPA